MNKYLLVFLVNISVFAIGVLVITQSADMVESRLLGIIGLISFVVIAEIIAIKLIH